jgi:hypothetical protein
MSATSGMRVVVVGGAGNFGARIVRALRGDPTIELVVAGRRKVSVHGAEAVRSVLIDIDGAGFAQSIRDLSPGLIIHCVGPFQGQDYRVANAALAAGAHYLDLADGRRFIADFAAAVNEQAVMVGRVAISGLWPPRQSSNRRRMRAKSRACPLAPPAALAIVAPITVNRCGRHTINSSRRQSCTLTGRTRCVQCGARSRLLGRNSLGRSLSVCRARCGTFGNAPWSAMQFAQSVGGICLRRRCCLVWIQFRSGL